MVAGSEPGNLPSSFHRSVLPRRGFTSICDADQQLGFLGVGLQKAARDVGSVVDVEYRGPPGNRLARIRLTLGGRSARREAKLMVAEKVDAAFRANVRLLAGASSDEIIQMYRRSAGANAKRLSKIGSTRTALGRRRVKSCLRIFTADEHY